MTAYDPWGYFLRGTLTGDSGVRTDSMTQCTSRRTSEPVKAYDPSAWPYPPEREAREEWARREMREYVLGMEDGA